MELYDVAIIGTGPGGLEAALTLKNRNKNFILFGSKDLSDKVTKAHEVKNYLGLPNIKGEDFQKAFLDHLNKMDIEITNAHVKQIYDMGDYYALQAEGYDEMFMAKSIIISTGVKMAKPFKGEDEFLGRGVSYCATCDAPLYKNKNVGVVIESMDELDEALFLASVCKNVYLFPQFNDKIEDKDNLKVFYEKPVEAKGERTVKSLVTDKGEYELDGLFVLRKSVPMTYLIAGIEMNNNHINVNRQMETNLRGVFACGDITGTPYQYIKAAGEGNVAALSAVKFLDSLKRGE